MDIWERKRRTKMIKVLKKNKEIQKNKRKAYNKLKQKCQSIIIKQGKKNA